MPANKKPRKPHNQTYQKGSLPLTIRFDRQAERDLQIFPQAALTKYTAGQAVESDWHCLVQRLNCGQVMAHWYFNESIRATCREALDAMVSVRARYIKRKTWGMTGDELRIVGFALTLTDDMQKKSTRRELSRVVNHVFAKAGVLKTGEMLNG